MTSVIQLGDRLIGPGYPCFIIAEAGVNHNGSLDMALKLVDVAVDAGADAVKFQKRDMKSLYPSGLLRRPSKIRGSITGDGGRSSSRHGMNLARDAKPGVL